MEPGRNQAIWPSLSSKTSTFRIARPPIYIIKIRAGRPAKAAQSRREGIRGIKDGSKTNASSRILGGAGCARIVFSSSHHQQRAAIQVRATCLTKQRDLNYLSTNSCILLGLAFQYQPKCVDYAQHNNMILLRIKNRKTLPKRFQNLDCEPACFKNWATHFDSQAGASRSCT